MGVERPASQCAGDHQIQAGHDDQRVEHRGEQEVSRGDQQARSLLLDVIDPRSLQGCLLGGGGAFAVYVAGLTPRRIWIEVRLNVFTAVVFLGVVHS